jgi:sugar lactone lactonase YvrE
MRTTAKFHSIGIRVRWLAALLLLTLLTALVAPVEAATAAAPPRPAHVIVLPGATSAEGIASGRGATFYAGDLFRGDIFRGNVRRGTAELFIDAPAGRSALGMKVDLAHHLLFVAGGFTGQGYVYDLRTRATVATYQFAAPPATVINDVALTRTGAWFTDSVQAKLYFVPVSARGVPGTFRTLAVTGPAADTSGTFNLNGIQATSNGKTLIVAHSTTGRLYTVNPKTGASATIAGITLPSVDGIVLRGHRLWAVQNINRVTRIRLKSHYKSGVVEKVITSGLFEVPSTAAIFGHDLAVVNAKFDTGFPPTAAQYEVVLVHG